MIVVRNLSILCEGHVVFGVQPIPCGTMLGMPTGDRRLLRRLAREQGWHRITEAAGDIEITYDLCPRGDHVEGIGPARIGAIVARVGI